MSTYHGALDVAGRSDRAISRPLSKVLEIRTRFALPRACSGTLVAHLAIFHDSLNNSRICRWAPLICKLPFIIELHEEALHSPHELLADSSQSSQK